MAAGLHEALTNLSPTDWDDVPRDDLGPYLSQCFSAAELLVNSVPPPANGTPFHSTQTHETTPNSAKSAKDVHPSSARPHPPDQQHADLQKHWGKPMKFSQKENPLNTALYKMAGNDRHGAWYARHTIMEGIGFAKFKMALKREFPETLLVQGQPGAGAKRGLSAERRVERIEVDGVGRLEVYQLSAQMPSPVSPRDFLTLLLTTDHSLTEKSAAEAEDGSKHVPRHFMVISRPLHHEEAPERTSFVRGQYESVELVREIPLQASKSTADQLSTGETHDPELNPVEWIMITRSDPAGGVPRFLVDRGTPGAMLTDITKFLDWACGEDEITDPDDDLAGQTGTGEQKTVENGQAEPPSDAAPVSRDAGAETIEQPDGNVSTPTQGGGMVSNLTQNLRAGVETYAPTSVANLVHVDPHPDPESSDSSSESSSDSFMSAEEMKRLSTAPEAQPRESTENASIASGASSSELSRPEDKKKLSQHEKEILKITQQREKLDQKLAKKRLAEENRLKQSQEKESSDQTKAQEKMDKEMKKTEEKHRKELEKLERKKEREGRKAEERKKKKEDQGKLSQVARERDESRSQSELLRKENDLLRDQVETLQRETTILVGRLGKLGGPDALKGIQEEAGTTKSSGSGISLGSGDSEKKE